MTGTLRILLTLLVLFVVVASALLIRHLSQADIHGPIAAGDIEKVKARLAKKPHLINRRGNDGQTPLHTAALLGRAEIVELLIDKGAGVNEPDYFANTNTALHLAADRGHDKVVRILLAKGADVKAQNNYLETPLHSAAASGSAAVVDLLIAADASLAAVNFTGDTPLHIAANNARVEVAGLLIDKGAKINAKNQDGWTPLHTAVNNGSKDVAELLIARGADLNAKDNNGRTPLDYAGARSDIADLLRKHSAEESAKPDIAERKEKSP